MRKTVLLVLPTAVACFMLAACGDKKANEQYTTTSTTTDIETSETAKNIDTPINGYTDAQLEKADLDGLNTLKEPADQTENSATIKVNEIVESLYDSHNIEAEENTSGLTNITYQAHILEENNVSWEDVLNQAGIEITDEKRQEYETVSNPVIQVENALIDVSRSSKRKDEYSKLLGSLESMVTFMNRNPRISDTDAFSAQISDFRTRYATFQNHISEKNPYITVDDLSSVKHAIVDAYNFLNDNGFEAPSIAANYAQQFITEFATGDINGTDSNANNAATDSADTTDSTDVAE